MALVFDHILAYECTRWCAFIRSIVHLVQKIKISGLNTSTGFSLAIIRLTVLEFEPLDS